MVQKGRKREAARVEVASPADMSAPQMSAHLRDHHPDVPANMGREEHAEDHARRPSDHYHKPSAAHRRIAHAADITRSDAVEPAASGTIYIQGYDEWGPEEYV